MIVCGGGNSLEDEKLSICVRSKKKMVCMMDTLHFWREFVKQRVLVIHSLKL